MARLLPLVAAAALLGPAASIVTSRRECGEVNGDFYQFSAKTLNGSETIAFEEYRGKVCTVPSGLWCTFDFSFYSSFLIAYLFFPVPHLFFAFQVVLVANVATY